MNDKQNCRYEWRLMNSYFNTRTMTMAIMYAILLDYMNSLQYISVLVVCVRVTAPNAIEKTDSFEVNAKWSERKRKRERYREIERVSEWEREREEEIFRFISFESKCLTLNTHEKQSPRQPSKYNTTENASRAFAMDNTTPVV